MKTIDALQNSGNRLSRRRGSIFIPLGLVALLAISPNLQAVVPAPDGGYPGGNTAEGSSALLSLSTGTYNTAVGLYSLRSLTGGSLCTGIGAGTLLVNTADQNTATGAGALLSNSTWQRQHGGWNVCLVFQYHRQRQHGLWSERPLEQHHCQRQHGRR